MLYSIAAINQMTQSEFVAVFGAVFEDTPAIAAQAWNARPFTDLLDLHQKMLNVVQSLSQAQQIALIQAHPDLGSRVRMADASVQEQSQVGLNQLTAEEFACLQRLNQDYKAKFGFPFIVAVRYHTKASILDTFKARLHNTQDTEIQTALCEIAQITRLRLHDLIELEPSLH
jgi:2-oxo-4-hydroxy-4-carboxy-5-ureidoimidazoline decarboxylase